MESTGHLPVYEEWWGRLKTVVEDYHDPGKFLALLGYEWHGDRRKYGDHNVIYLDSGGVLDPEPSLDPLYENLRSRKALVIPHHTTYKRGRRGKDWNHWDEELSPVAEIYSSHGSSETVPSYRPLENNVPMSPGTSATTWQAALDKGYRIGAIASNDGPGLPGSWGKGLAGVWADSLTREDVYEALKERRTYGVTGDRIRLQFRVNGAPMGSLISGADSAEISYRIRCPDALDRIELVHNGLQKDSYYHPDRKVKGGKGNYSIRVDFGWGPERHFGFPENLTRWTGSLKLAGGRLTGVGKCFSYPNQHLEWKDDGACWNLKLPRGSGHRDHKQSLIFKIRGDGDTEVRIFG